MILRKREYLQALFCLILLFLPPLLVTGPILHQGDIPVNLEGMTLRAPWQEARVQDTDIQEVAGSDELIERYYPWYAFLNQAAANRELPLWNPYEGFGIPFMALWRTRAFSPFSLPLYFLPLSVALSVSLFAKLTIAGLCAYYVARRFQFTPAFSLLVAIPFQLSGIFLVAHWHPASDVAPFFPLILPCLQRLLLGDRRGWPYLALLIGIMTMGGDPESLAATLFFMYVLVIVYGIRTYQRDRIRGALLWLTLSSVVGLALAGIQLTPYVEFLQHGSLENKSGSFFTPWDLTSLFTPPILGDGAFAPQRAALWLPTGMVAFLLLPLWFSLRSFANRIRKRRLEALLFSIVFTFLFSAALGPWLRRIPGMALLDVTHFMIPFPLAMGILAGTTADEWVHLDAQKCQMALKKLFRLLPLCWALFLAAAIPLLWFGPAREFELVRLIPLAVCALCVFLLILITLLWPRPLFTALSLTLVTSALLWYVYQPHARVTPAARMTPQTQLTDALDHENNRVAGSEQLKNWPLSPYGVAQVYSPSGVMLHRGASFLSQTEDNPELLRLTASNQLILTKMDIKERFAALRPVLNIQEVLPSGAILLRDLQAHPRSRIVYRARQIAPGEAPPALRSDGPPLSEGGALPENSTDKSITEAGIRGTQFNLVEIVAESGNSGILVLADSWYPGWKVFLDGTLTPVFPVDIAFRGIEIGKGNHKAIFEYRPESLRLGMYITAGALILVLIGFRTFFRRHRAA